MATFMINFYTYSFIKSYLNTSNVPAKKKKWACLILGKRRYFLYSKKKSIELQKSKVYFYKKKY